MIRLDRFLDSRPERCAGLAVRRGDIGYFLADDDDDEVCEMNESAAAVWELCDGHTSVAEIVEAVCLACNLDRAHAVDDLRRIVTELSTAGLIRWRLGGESTDEERS